jgi:BlaI family penicillinase repressor
MPAPDISESEWILMEALWDSAPKTASELTRQLAPSTHWAENTVRTLLGRLVEKGALAVGENQSGTRTYQPAVSRETCVKSEGDSFLQRVFRGAAKPLLMHFAQGTKLSPEDVRELKKLLDQSLKS